MQTTGRHGPSTDRHEPSTDRHESPTDRHEPPAATSGGRTDATYHPDTRR